MGGSSAKKSVPPLGRVADQFSGGQRKTLCFCSECGQACKRKQKLALYQGRICSGCSVPEVMSWKSCLGSPALESCPGSPILAVQYWQSCTGSLVLAVCSGISDLHVIIFLSHFACPIWAVLFRLFLSSCPVPAVLSQLSCPSCPVLAVLF